MTTIDPKRNAAVPGGLDAAAIPNLRSYLHLRLSALGHETLPDLGIDDNHLQAVVGNFIADYQEKSRLLKQHQSPVDERIQNVIHEQLGDVADGLDLRLPSATLILDRYGMARECSLPADRDEFTSDIVSSYRLANGVLNNPKSDRRTTKGVFHVCDCEFPVPADKFAIPKRTFACLLNHALKPPQALLQLPYTADLDQPIEAVLSLLLRPLVMPAVPGKWSEKRMETRFFAPGNMASNLDFVESIFGNGGDPFLPQNDAALDADGWTGTTGCVILAPHLIGLTKKELGLPPVAEATERQRAQGMCWESEDELYNNGGAFKATLRTRSGAMVTIIADNYYGYCKKEVKTQISFSANLFGLAEEEHAGGALAFASYNLGDEFIFDGSSYFDGHAITDLPRLMGDAVDMQPEGHAIDKQWSSVVYIPESSTVSLKTGTVSWPRPDGSGTEEQRLNPDCVYVLPNGYKVQLQKHPGAPTWRLIGTQGEGTFCHKPCTVSGGGKSEISKSLTDAIIYGSLYINDVDKDLDRIEELCKRDYGDRLKPEFRPDRPSRPLLSPERSLGSVIKLFTSSPDYTDEYNEWLETIPKTLLPLLFIIKRFYKEEWGEDWRSHFGVDIVNGYNGHEFKYHDRRLVASYLRVGMGDHDTWRTYKLRQDFIPCEKVQMEDDITASAVVAEAALPFSKSAPGGTSVKISQNCEFRLFQRPDEAIIRGYDKQTEEDLAGANNFISNFEPLTTDEVRDLTEEVLTFGDYTAPMKDMLAGAVADGKTYAVSSAHPRIVDGKPTKNPRYLQDRPDLVRPRDRYLAEVGIRLKRQIPVETAVPITVAATLGGRRNNPADEKLGVPALAVYNPLHYQELPELFMDYICSVTGKSPSTTGFGSEGALTKGPFNCLPTTADLNAALISSVLTGGVGWTSAAGCVGPKVRVDHDVSLLVPEIWARLSDHERDPNKLMADGFLEPVSDFEHDGQTVLASRIGYRITDRFVIHFLGRIFDNPRAVFDAEMLRPETQDLATFVDGVNNLVESQRRVAQAYIDDGTISGAVPPLQVLLTIMATGAWEGKDAHHPEVRAMFTREAILESDWYQERLVCKQGRDVAYWQRAVSYLESFLERDSHADQAQVLGVKARLDDARQQLAACESTGYLQELQGTLGADPLSFDESSVLTPVGAAAAG